MKTLELKLKKDVLIVDENDFGYYTNIDNEIIFHLGNVRLRRVKGNFKLLCKGSELTEEIASELVEYWQNMANDGFIYENYKTNIPKKKTAVEAFISAVESKGFHWLDNPISDPNKIIQTSLSFKKFAKHSESFDRAEEKTFRNPLIFVKK